MNENISKLYSQSSVEVAKNSRGYTYSAKAYGFSAKEIEEKLRNMIAIAEKIIEEKEKDGGSENV